MVNHDEVLIVRGDAELRCYWRAMEGQPFADVDPADFGIERRKAKVKFLSRDWPYAASVRLSIDGKRRTYPVRHGLYGLVVRPDR